MGSLVVLAKGFPGIVGLKRLRTAIVYRMIAINLVLIGHVGNAVIFLSLRTRQLLADHLVSRYFETVFKSWKLVSN